MTIAAAQGTVGPRLSTVVASLGAMEYGLPVAYPSTEYPDLVENEALCYALAEAVGIITAGATSRPIAEPDLPDQVTKAFFHYLNVPRFDRALQPDGTIRRLHFEDLPQAMQALLGVHLASHLRQRLAQWAV